MSYAETVYAQMLQMQMRGAQQAWAEAERKKEMQSERKQREFDQFSGIMDWLLKAQQERHREEMDMAKLAGAGEGRTGKSSGMNYAGRAGEMQQAARIASRGDMESEIVAERRRENAMLERMMRMQQPQQPMQQPQQPAQEPQPQPVAQPQQRAAEVPQEEEWPDLKVTQKKPRLSGQTLTPGEMDILNFGSQR